MENTKYRVLFVEDNDADQIAFARVVESEKLPYEYQIADSVEKAKSILDCESFDAIVCDYSLGDGKALDIMDSVPVDTAVIIVTGVGDEEIAVKAMKAGVSDYLVKDYDRKYLKVLPHTIENACSYKQVQKKLVDSEKKYRVLSEKLSEIRDVSVFALAGLAESRDTESGGHLERIRRYCQILAEELSKNSEYSSQIDAEFIHDLYRSSPLHDIGKVGIPDSILLKPGKLTENEFEIMKQHTVIGAATLRKAVGHTNYGGGFLAMSIDITRYHHEYFDGNGYPDGLKLWEIPLAARIVGLADVYDALTSARVYKPEFRPEIAKNMIIEERGTHFDPVIVDAFLARYADFIAVKKSEYELETSVAGEETFYASSGANTSHKIDLGL